MRMVIMVVLGLVISAPSIAQTHICQPAIDAQLQKDGIALNQVTSISIGRERTSGEDGSLYGYKYWIRMKSCKKGHLIIDLDLYCDVKGVYTSGPCEIAGVHKC